MLRPSVSLVIAEAVFDTHNNPNATVNQPAVEDSDRVVEGTNPTHHRFVNTTPKPKATKNSSGELVGPPPPPPPPPPEFEVGDGVGMLEAVEVAMIALVDEGPGRGEQMRTSILIEVYLPFPRLRSFKSST